MSENETTGSFQEEQPRFTAREWIKHRSRIANLVEGEMARTPEEMNLATNIAETLLYNDLINIASLDAFATHISIVSIEGEVIRTATVEEETPLCDDTSCGVIRPHEHGGDCDGSCGCQDNLGGR
ncbi:hypothetical protein K8P10_001962 [Leucobacter sp. Psy1]|uniref:hypothetical protein n=1 Tax=Leucobacter sp. Psy1 TaxID=2875729 RepID=UPI001CD64F87|nr:hypothetical protein [Leucobacter sp. Psy1]UBH06451.1 hypothetical protein K8P10_001962 [Leucobacter sp. Psy1]